MSSSPRSSSKLRRAVVLAVVGGVILSGLALFLSRRTGRGVVDGPLSFTPRALRCVGEVMGDEFFSAVAERGTFCIVEVRVENLGKEPVTYVAEHQRALVGSDEFAPSEQGLDATVEGHVERRLEPGSAVDLLIVFDVPSRPHALSFHASAETRGAITDVTALPERSE
ncbi:MAG TPA: DUF4352 domain-containing protein [Actinomycetota bacterium]|nr:DUF4352 domain-containing protein [Actinomycetota bacterium]